MGGGVGWRLREQGAVRARGTDPEAWFLPILAQVTAKPGFTAQGLGIPNPRLRSCRFFNRGRVFSLAFFAISRFARFFAALFRAASLALRSFMYCLMFASFSVRLTVRFARGLAVSMAGLPGTRTGRAARPLGRRSEVNWFRRCVTFMVAPGAGPGLCGKAAPPWKSKRSRAARCDRNSEKLTGRSAVFLCSAVYRQLVFLYIPKNSSPCAFGAQGYCGLILGITTFLLR